jgi:hypothetical protein
LVEVVIKSQKDALGVGDLRQWWLETLDALASAPDPSMSRPFMIFAIHQDPFDRALVAQMIAEDLNL